MATLGSYTEEIARELQYLSYSAIAATDRARKYIAANPETMLTIPPERAAIECAWEDSVREVEGILDEEAARVRSAAAPHDQGTPMVDFDQKWVQMSQAEQEEVKRSFANSWKVVERELPRITTSLIRKIRKEVGVDADSKRVQSMLLDLILIANRGDPQFMAVAMSNLGAVFRMQ